MPVELLLVGYLFKNISPAKAWRWPIVCGLKVFLIGGGSLLIFLYSHQGRSLGRPCNSCNGTIFTSDQLNYVLYLAISYIISCVIKFQ